MTTSARMLVVAMALSLAAPAFAQPLDRPDPSAGEIDGKKAVLLWPADGRVTDCRATLVPETDPDTEIHHPCGEWFVPPPGEYRAWIEGPSSISAVPTKLSYSSNDLDGSGLLAVIGTVAAGEASLRESWPETSLRLVHLESFSSGALLTPAFERRSSGETVAGIRMPEGRVLAGVFDRGSGDAVALARPVSVIAGRMTYIEPALPERGADVLVLLDRPRARERRDDEIVTLHLDVDGEQTPPSVFADSADRVYAVWYGVEGRRARVVASGRELTFPGREFRLLPRRVITVRDRLRPLPRLRVEITPGADIPSDARVQAKRLSGEILIEVPLDAPSVDLGHLPAETIEVMLLSPEIEMRRRADLTSGIDETVRFGPDALTIHGRLTRGNRGVPGTITFTLGTRTPTSVTTSDDGTYTATLWSAGSYMIAAAASGTAPFRIGSHHLTRDRELNIELPRANVVVEVMDGQKKTAVAGASVVATAGEDDSPRALARTQRVITDDRGMATLPPMDPGITRLFVTAENYLAGEHVIEVADSDDPQHFSVELTPADVNPTNQLTLLLADGTPASAAQLILMDAGMSQVLWSGRTDASGGVAVPKSDTTILFVRHPRAGSIPLVMTDSREVRLPAPAPPLAVRFVRANGTAPPTAEIILWVGGIRIAGGVMSFLYGVPNGTNVDGVWRATNLPQAPLRILAVASEAGRSAPEALETWAVTIPYPWPDFPTFRVAE